MEINLYNTKEISQTIRVEVTFNEFKRLMNLHKPKELFVPAYSEKTPSWVITEYLDDDNVLYYATGWADKTPVKESLNNLYLYWRHQGLNQCKFYSKIEDNKVEDLGQGKTKKQYEYSAQAVFFSLVAMGVLSFCYLIHEFLY